MIHIPQREKIHLSCSCGACTGRHMQYKGLSKEHARKAFRAGRGTSRTKEEFYEDLEEGRRQASRHIVYKYRQDVRRSVHRSVRNKYRSELRKVEIGKRDYCDIIYNHMVYTD